MSMEQLDLERLLKQNKDIVVIVVILLISLFSAKKVYDTQIGKYRSLKSQIETEQEKGQSLDRIVITNEKIKKFRSRSWKGTDFNAVVEKVSQLAGESSVKILNIMPQNKKDDAHYIAIPFQISAESSYRDALQFLKKIEMSPFLMHVRDIVLSPQREGVSEDKAAQGRQAILQISLTVEAYYFK